MLQTTVDIVIAAVDVATTECCWCLYAATAAAVATTSTAVVIMAHAWWCSMASPVAIWCHVVVIPHLF